MSLKTQKLGSLFTKEISRIILEEVKNPKIKFVTITGCEITNDLSFAKVSFLVLNREDKEEIEKALNSAANFIEVSLSKCIDIRKMPQISFHYDNSVEYGESIERKIQELKDEDKM